jgi:hypothetical protein
MSTRCLTALWAVLLALAACRGDERVPLVEGVIDRETFIEVYVDLRVATLEGQALALPEEERDRILASHGVDGEDLIAFVDAYGRELDYMNGVWSEVEQRLETRSPAPDLARDRDRS